MPYIDEERREKLDYSIQVLSTSNLEAGDLNYVITRLLHIWCILNPRYASYNAAIGVLECVKQEFYRRVVALYEDKKKEENGDVF